MAHAAEHLSVPRRPTRVWLRVRRLVLGLAWLGAPPRWSAGRVVWAAGRASLQPTPADLRAAAVALERLARNETALARLVGPARPWLAARAAALAEARYLAALPRADLPGLEAQARAGLPAALGALAALLPAEALCRGELAPAPSAVLGACGSGAEQPLHALAANQGAPLAGRALAALLLGARASRSGGPSVAPSDPAAPLLGRAYEVGLRRGPTLAPRLDLALSADPGGVALAERLAAAEALAPRCRLSAAVWRELLASAHAPEHLVALAEAAAAVEPLVVRLVALYGGAPPAHGRVPAAVRRGRADVARLVVVFHAYLAATADPAVGGLFIRFVEATLALAEHPAPLLRAATITLEDGLSLAPELRGPYLSLLVELHAVLWEGPRRLALYTSVATLITTMSQQQARYIGPVRRLLALTGDPALVAAAVRRGVVNMLPLHTERYAPLFRWVLSLLDAFPSQASLVAEQLSRLICQFATAAAARAALGPYMQVLLSAPPALRADLLVRISLPRGQAALARALPRLARYVARLAEAAGDAVPPWYAALTPGLLDLDRRSPVAAETLLEAALAVCRPDGPRCAQTLHLGLLLASVVAPTDEPATLRAIVEAAARHELACGSGRLQVGIFALRRLPALAQVFARLFPQQPARIFRLLEHIAMAEALGPDGLAPLAEMAPELSGGLFSPALHTALSGWRELLALAPAAEGLAAAYLHACWVLGVGQGLPAGVRKALALPARMAAEREHLARLVAAAPGRADLAARLSALEARLGNPDFLWAAAGREAAERLAQVAAERQLDAAELLVEEGFRARLAAIAGPLPPGLALDDDLRNAVLLSADIGTNRALLRRLLQAELAGETGWREALPANAAFLAELAAGGVDVAAWLGEHPASSSLPGVPGGRVTLALERRPLSVLQMGNYFGTCLSLGGGNAFSTVANAVDLNKRVLYARDGSGRVVGRKLIGVSADGRLLGYYTYRSTGSPAADDRLATMISVYVRAFAAVCGLALADRGAVPTLVAECWYDDGEVAWEQDTATMNEQQLTRISKALAYYLRHHPDELGLTLGPGGWVAVDELLDALARRGKALTRAQLDEVVARNSKRRFAFDEGGARIRASQGHSVAVDLQLEPAEPPAVLYHGTAQGSVAAILREGLQRRSRHHVHLSAEVATARSVGARHGPPAILLVDAAAMAAAGQRFYHSANSVWLADEVPPAYLRLLE